MNSMGLVISNHPLKTKSDMYWKKHMKKAMPKQCSNRLQWFTTFCPAVHTPNKWGPTWVLHNDMWGFTSSGFDPSSIAPILVQGAIPETNLISIALAEAPNVADLSWRPWAPGRSLKHGVEWVRAADICLNYLYSVFCGFSGGVLKA